MNNSTMVRVVKITFTVLLAMICIYIGVRLCMTAYDFGFRVFTEDAIDEEEDAKDVLIQIKDGMTDHDIAVVMEEKGLIRDANLFWIQLALFEYSGKLEPGVYTLNTSMTPKEIMVSIVEAAEEAAAEAETETEDEPIADLSDEGGTQAE
ncbi:MAG: endolytic transglycosylase MltG [Clostridiales bacterium]|nr:endolytic transglycosylase MltG [Clostridiales bacterium]